MIRRFDDPLAAGRWCEEQRELGRTLGLVPTMGALHDGHLGLVRRAVAQNDRAVASVFVNPLQFNEARDFERYPRDFEADVRLLERSGCAMVFTGTLRQFFGQHAISDVELAAQAWVEPGPCALSLEGEHRPGHFRGVATIVARLFELCRPTRAYFGAKDFQQCLVVSDLARRLGFPEVIVCPTAREPSGLAMSSRNLLLDDPGRARAADLFGALQATRAAWRGGERGAEVLARTLRAGLAGRGLELEYAELRDPQRWTEVQPKGRLERGIALVAARVGGVRLIDNLRLDDGEDPA